MEKKQILKKSKMKVNQAEGSWFSIFFIPVLQFTAIRWSTRRHHFLEIHIQSYPQVHSQLCRSHCLSFLTGWDVILLPSTYSWRCRRSCLLMWGYCDFLTLPWPQEAGGQSLATLTQASHDSIRTSLSESLLCLPFPLLSRGDQAVKHSALGFPRLLTIFSGSFLWMLSSKCLIALHL